MDYELEIDGKKLTLPDCNLKPKFEVVHEEPPPPAKKARAAKAARVRRNPIITAGAPQIDITIPPLPDGVLIPTPFNVETIRQLQAFQQTPNGDVLPTGMGILGMIGAAIVPALLFSFGTLLKK